MAANRKNETAQAELRPLQFRSRNLFVLTTGAAIVSAAIAGAFGTTCRILTIYLLTFVLGWPVMFLIMVAPWIVLMWLCQQLAGFIKNCRRGDH